MELQFIIDQVKDAYNGDPWFGRSTSSLLSEIDESIAFEKPGGQHSIVELIWHMVNWREFVISRLVKDPNPDIQKYEVNDWREVRKQDHNSFQNALDRFHQTQGELLDALNKFDASLMLTQVNGRSYNYKKLLHGIVQHDIYHLGQIAYIKKMLSKDK